MTIVTKRIRGRLYYYEQHSTRVNGKVVTKSRYLGPVEERKRRSAFDASVSWSVSFIVFALKEHKIEDRLHEDVTAKVLRDRVNQRMRRNEDLERIRERQKVFAARDPKQIWERALAEEEAERRQGERNGVAQDGQEDQK